MQHQLDFSAPLTTERLLKLLSDDASMAEKMPILLSMYTHLKPEHFSKKEISYPVDMLFVHGTRYFLCSDQKRAFVEIPQLIFAAIRKSHINPATFQFSEDPAACFEMNGGKTYFDLLSPLVRIELTQQTCLPQGLKVKKNLPGFTYDEQGNALAIKDSKQTP